MIERSELWSVEGGRVLSAIKLSYDHLPSLSLKQCFAYCAIYPKDTELKKDILVQHWMAQGLLNPPKGSQLQMEDVGNMYFSALLRSSLLQDAKRGRNNELTCTMHDLVHDFALKVSEIRSIDMNEGKVGSHEIDVVHLRFINFHCKSQLKSFKSVIPSKLRTLHLGGYFPLDDWFEKFRCLTVLTIEFRRLEKLSKAIGKITHLRFLDICDTNVHTLPKSLGKLYFLETLRYSYLSRLPVGFENLTNLRQMIDRSKVYTSNHSKVYLIPGLSKMTNIQTVPFFKVDKSKGCQIEELEHLDSLKGTLRIFGLENVSSCESASRSKLPNKSQINALELYWDRREHECDDTEVMEGLKPHCNVKILEIDGYQSPRFPSWMKLLRHLTKIALNNLDKCEELPSFGDLPCLEVLQIKSLRNLKCIGKEFYGWSNLDWVTKNSSSHGPEVFLFPTLKELDLCDMASLEEWSDAFTSTHSSVKTFPSLERMRIAWLPNLSVFPNLGNPPCLRELHMFKCPNLALPSYRNSSMLQNSEPDIDYNRDIHYLPSLHLLEMSYCDKFVAPFCSLNIARTLKRLHITGNASFWPKNLHNLINLEELVLSGDDSSSETDSFPLPYSVSTSTHNLADIQYPVSLASLHLHGWSKITSLPDQTQYLTTLRKLHIEDFDGLEAIPEWLCNMKCLEELHIQSCKNLKQLPSAEALKCLSNLKCLTSARNYHLRRFPVHI